MNDTLNRLARSQVCQSDKAYAVIFAYAIIIPGVAEGQSDKALLLEIGLVDSREATGDDRRAAQEPGRQRSVLATTTFAVVIVADYDPLQALALVIPRNP